MAERQFLLVQRNLAICGNKFIFSLLLVTLFGFAGCKRIDNGGVSVPIRLERNGSGGEGGSGGGEGAGALTVDEILDGYGYDTGPQNPVRPHPPGRLLALRNRPLRLRCPIELEKGVRILDVWWVKDGHRLTLPTTEQGRVRLQGRDIVFEKVVHKIGSGKERVPGVTGGIIGTEVVSNSGGGLAGVIGLGGIGGGLNRHQNYSDEGSYECWVKSSIGVVFSPMIHLAVAGFEVGDHEENVEKNTGEWVVIRCPVRSVPTGAVSWSYIDGNNNSVNIEGDDGRIKLLSSGSVLVRDLRTSDSGTYKCSVRNEILNRERRSETKLSVTDSEETQSETSDTGVVVSPKFLEVYERQHIVVEPEESIALDCVAYGVPLPTITWVLTFKHDNSSPTLPVSNILSDGKTGFDRIYLTPGNLTVSGNYTCLVRNGVGPTLTNTLQVSRVPVLREQLESQQFPPAKTVRFECPVPESFYLLWYKDGQLLEPGQGRVKSRGSDLVISNTIRNDSGFYQCEVLADERVYAVGTARLLVDSTREQPNAPADLKCTAVSSRAINVTWKSSNKLDFQAFSIHYMANGELERQQVTKSSNFLIETLKPHTNYTIYMRVYNGRSASGQSEKIYCTTLQDVPINAPRPLVFERFGPSTHVRIKWKPIPNSEARGIIVVYKIQWRPIPGSFINVRYLDGSSDEFLVTDLTPDTNYEARVIPATTKGYPYDKERLPWFAIPPKVDLTAPSGSEGATEISSSNETTSDHTEGVSSGSRIDTVSLEHMYDPPTLQLSILNATTLLVRWEEPSTRPNVTPKGFRLTYSTYSPIIDDVVYYGPIYVLEYEAREHLITNLDTATSYEFSVQTFGEGWESMLATASVRMPSISPTDEEKEGDNVLPMITGLRALPLSSSVIRLTWNPVMIVGNATTHLYSYIIKCNRVDSSDYEYIRSDQETVDIRNLLPYTAYEFVVSYEDKTQDENSTEDVLPITDRSLKIESRTLAGIPDPPTGLKWVVTSNQSIFVSWLPPPRPNGVIQRYWVEYTNSSRLSTPSVSGIIDGNSDHNWMIVSTNITSISITNLTANHNYKLRVRAETAAGVGAATETQMKIFLTPLTSTTTPPPMVNDQNQAPGSPDFRNKQHLGIILGTTIGFCCFIVCATIFVFRNRCFPYLSRSRNRSPRQQAYANGNGHGPRWKRSVESLNGVEMKALQTFTATDEVLDTKGSNVHGMNGGLISGPNQDGVSDPLLMRIVRNPMEQQQDDVELDGQLSANRV